MSPTNGLLFELSARLSETRVELHHLPAEQRAELAEHLLVPGVVLQRHLALHAREVYHHRPVLAPRVRRVERRARLPSRGQRSLSLQFSYEFL